MNDWELALMECSDPTGTFSLRSFQAEILAFDVYQRVLKDDALREHFRSDESITRLWDSTNDKIREIWGAPVDLAQRVKERYNPVHGWL
jgi:truncated hemoglobin YjbI